MLKLTALARAITKAIAFVRHIFFFFDLFKAVVVMTGF
jgi:hypothetical protein